LAVSTVQLCADEHGLSRIYVYRARGTFALTPSSFSRFSRWSFDHASEGELFHGWPECCMMAGHTGATPPLKLLDQNQENRR